jgi:hypothetical protein
LAGFSTSREGKRIFLARGGTRREYNQKELLDISVRYGFEEVHMQDLTLREQAELFQSSSMIIGPSGAAWVGMVFRGQPTSGLSWLPRVYDEFCSYSTLANLLGHQLSFIDATPDKELRSTGEAYGASYRVCPVEFESALRQLVNRQSL